jgi:hypothetical protein
LNFIWRKKKILVIPSIEAYTRLKKMRLTWIPRQYCDICLSALCDASPNKKSPLLELIYNQNRRNLNYPNKRFIKLVECLVQIIQEILPYFPHKKVDYILNKIFISYLYINPIFRCKIHNYSVCSIIIGKLVSPVLSNYCNSKKQFFKKTNILTKKRKLMKLN